MNNIKYLALQLLGKLPFINGEKLIIRTLRKEVCKIGKNTHIFSNIVAGEPYLVEIGDNCTISTDVVFITYDASIGLYLCREKYSDLYGKISVGNNCFIGNRTIILYGVTILDNTIVVAGSVVTKSILEPKSLKGVISQKIWQKSWVC